MLKLIAVTGPDGAGKSTLTNELQKIMTSRGPKASCVDVWDILTDIEFKKSHPFENKLQVGLYLKACDPLPRAMFIFHCLMQSIHLAQKKDLDFIFINSYWYKYYISEMLYGVSSDHLNALVSTFPSVDKIIYLKITPEEAALRKKIFSAYESGQKGESKENFLEMQSKSIPLWENLSKRYSFLTFDGMRPINELTFEILKVL